MADSDPFGGASMDSRIELEAYDVMQNPCKFYQEVTESLSISGSLIGCFKEYVGLLCPMIQGEDSWRAVFREALEASGNQGSHKLVPRELPGYDVYLISVSGKRMGAIAQTLQLNYPSLF